MWDRKGVLQQQYSLAASPKPPARAYLQSWCIWTEMTPTVLVFFPWESSRLDSSPTLYSFLRMMPRSIPKRAVGGGWSGTGHIQYRKSKLHSNDITGSDLKTPQEVHTPQISAKQASRKDSLRPHRKSLFLIMTGVTSGNWFL